MERQYYRAGCPHCYSGEKQQKPTFVNCHYYLKFSTGLIIRHESLNIKRLPLDSKSLPGHIFGHAIYFSAISPPKQTMSL